MKINAIREYYRENQCNTFCLSFPCIFTLPSHIDAFYREYNMFSNYYIWDTSVVIFLLWLCCPNISY